MTVWHELESEAPAPGARARSGGRSAANQLAQGECAQPNVERTRKLRRSSREEDSCSIAIDGFVQVQDQAGNIA